MRRGWNPRIGLGAVAAALLIAHPTMGRTSEQPPAPSAERAPARAFALADLLAIARESAPRLRQALAGIDAARGGHRAARLWPDPILAAAAGHGESEDTALSGSESVLSFGQSIPWPSAYRASVSAAAAEVEVAVSSADAVWAEIEQSVKEQFYGLLAAERLSEILREHLEAARGLEDLAERRVALGAARELDRLKARIERLTVERQARGAEVDVGVRRRSLDRFLLGGLGESFTLKGDLAVSDEVVPREDLLSRLRASNRRLAEARAMSEAARRGLSAARAGRFPGVSFEAARDREIDKTSLSAGVGLTVPLWNANRGRIAQAVSEAVAAEAREASVRAEIETEFEAAYSRFRFALEQSRVFEEDLLPAARDSLAIARFSYEQGATSLLDLLDARRVYLATVADAYRTSYEHFAARAALERIVGGPLHED